VRIRANENVQRGVGNYKEGAREKGYGDEFEVAGVIRSCRMDLKGRRRYLPFMGSPKSSGESIGSRAQHIGRLEGNRRSVGARAKAKGLGRATGRNQAIGRWKRGRGFPWGHGRAAAWKRRLW
jgi:hypothetical protein